MWMAEHSPTPLAVASKYDICMISTLPTPILVTSDHALADAALRWQQCGFLAMDTEFVRTDTFFAKLGLIQISDGNDCWLIDPLAIDDWAPLAALMINSNIVKVFHATSEDLEVLNQALGCIPQPLFDTQVAAALTGYGFSRGYSALVKVLLGIELEKHETRSDWTRRPLSDAQLGYAAEDVHYLAAIYPMLQQRLAALGRTEWLAEDMQLLTDKASETNHMDQYYQKVKSAWHLKPGSLALLQRLCTWREQEARLCDKPRNRVVADKVLLEIALHWPGNRSELGELRDMHPRIVRVYGERLLALVAESHNLAEHEYPAALPQPLPREAGASLKQLKKKVVEVAEQLDLPPEMLARKRDMETIMRSVYETGTPSLPSSLADGWRFTIIGEPLLEVANSL